MLPRHITICDIETAFQWWWWSGMHYLPSINRKTLKILWSKHFESYRWRGTRAIEIALSPSSMHCHGNDFPILILWSVQIIFLSLFLFIFVALSLSIILPPPFILISRIHSITHSLRHRHLILLFSKLIIIKNQIQAMTCFKYDMLDESSHIKWRW